MAIGHEEVPEIMEPERIHTRVLQKPDEPPGDLTRRQGRDKALGADFCSDRIRDLHKAIRGVGLRRLTDELAVFIIDDSTLDMYPATAIYVAVPFAIPAILAGFFKFQGYLSVFGLVREYLFSRRCKSLVFEAEEMPGTQVFSMKKREETTKRRNKKEHNRTQ